MEISLALILDLLGYEYETGSADTSLLFDGIELLGEEQPLRSCKTLYVGGLSSALYAQKKDPSLHFLCVRDRMVDERETKDAMAQICVVKRNLSLQELFNQTQRIYLRVVNWKMQLLRSVSRREGIQVLMDLSEPMIGNHIAVMDSSFKLIGYTRHVKTDDQVSNELMRHGFHSQDTIERFQQLGRYSQFEKEDRMIVSDDYAMSDYVTVKRIFHKNNTYTMLAVMVCCEKYSQGILELFGILVDMLEIYVDSGMYAEGTGRPMITLIRDIMEGKLKTSEEISRRASLIGMKLHGTFQLMTVRFLDEANIPFRRVVAELSNAFPLYDIVLYQKQILLFYQGEISKQIQKQLQNVLKLYEFQCGVSNLFSSLSQLPTAYKQAEAAIRIGSELTTRKEEGLDKKEKERGKLYAFKDYVLYYQMQLILQHQEGMITNSMALQSLRILKENASSYSVDYLNILQTFLQCERRATLASARLCMHRNTVLYHIDRIQEMLGIDLDDCDVRLELLMGFKMLELQPLE